MLIEVKTVEALDAPKANDHVSIKSSIFSESYILHEHIFVVNAISKLT
jgi:hypothetical protein